MRLFVRMLVIGMMFLGLAANAQAQDANSFIEMMRKDIKAEKSAVITMAMDFTEEQAEVFWPIYRDYEHEFDKLADERLQIIKDYAKSFDSMTEDIAKDLVNRSFKTQEQRLKLDKKYWKKLSKELSPIVAARFFQVNGQINDLIDLQIASELPLVEDTGSDQ